MEKIRFTMKNNKKFTEVRTVEEAQTFLRKAYNDDTVDLFILNILMGKVASFTLKGTIVEAKLETE